MTFTSILSFNLTNYPSISLYHKLAIYPSIYHNYLSIFPSHPPNFTSTQGVGSPVVFSPGSYGSLVLRYCPSKHILPLPCTCSTYPCTWSNLEPSNSFKSFVPEICIPIILVFNNPT